VDTSTLRKSPGLSVTVSLLVQAIAVPALGHRRRDGRGVNGRRSGEWHSDRTDGAGCDELSKHSGRRVVDLDLNVGAPKREIRAVDPPSRVHNPVDEKDGRCLDECTAKVGDRQPDRAIER
jgi:hypothetical protein